MTSLATLPASTGSISTLSGAGHECDPAGRLRPARSFELGPALGWLRSGCPARVAGLDDVAYKRTEETGSHDAPRALLGVVASDRSRHGSTSR